MDSLHPSNVFVAVFVAVCAANGFASGARKLGISPPAVTRAINELETHLGVRLLARTTRIVKVAEAGARYAEECRHHHAQASRPHPAVRRHAVCLRRRQRQPTPLATPPPAPAVVEVSPGAAGGNFTSGVVAISNPTPMTEIQPAPASIGADMPATYFGTASSTVQKELIGPYQWLKAGTVDQDAGTITLPLYKGQLASGEAIWYILTDTTDEKNAATLGPNFSAKLNYADVGKGARRASRQLIKGKTVVVFESGKVDFSPVHAVSPGAAPHYFPPAAAQPGSVGDANYSPLVKIGNYLYNAPMLAFHASEATLNVLGGIPTIATDYSPLWDLNIGEWTQHAIDNDYRARIREEFEILGHVRNEHLNAPGGAPFGSSGLIVNCPIVFRFL